MFIFRPLKQLLCLWLLNHSALRAKRARIIFHENFESYPKIISWFCCSMKIRQKYSNFLLGSYFGIGEDTVQEYFATTVVYANHAFHHDVCHVWTKENVHENEINNIFSRINANIDPMYDEIRKSFPDPRPGLNGEAVILCIDSTKLETGKSSDREIQSALYCNYKSSKYQHMLKTR